MNWQDNLIENTEEIRALLQTTKRIAVLGIKTEAQADQPSVYVPHVSQESRLRNRSGAGLLSRRDGDSRQRKSIASLTDIPGDIDMVDVFRRSHDVAGHIDDILAKKPNSVWLQSGIRNDAAAEIFAKAGIKVVQDR